MQIRQSNSELQQSHNLFPELMLRPLTKPARERGQSIVMVALMLTAVIAFSGMALAAGGGQFFLMRRQMQNAADAAALASAAELAAGDGSLVYYRLNQYAVGNAVVGNGASSVSAQYLPANVEVTPGSVPPPGTQCLRVTTHKSLLGLGLLDASATSIGCLGQVAQPSAALWPMVVRVQDFKLNQSYDLLSDQNALGQFGWLAYDGSDAASDVRSKLQNAYAGPYQVYSASTCDGAGQTSAPSLRLSNCVKGASAVATSDQTAAAAQLGETVIIPIYDRTQSNGANTYYHIVGFGAFKLTGVCLQADGAGDCAGANGKTIRGQFVSQVIGGQFCASDCGPDYGLKTVRLSQ